MSMWCKSFACDLCDAESYFCR